MKVLFRPLAISLIVVMMAIVDCRPVLAGDDSQLQNLSSFKVQKHSPLFFDHSQEKLSVRSLLDSTDSTIHYLKLPAIVDSSTEWKTTVLQASANFAPEIQSHVGANKIAPTNGGSYSWLGVVLLILLVKFTHEPN